MDLIQHTIPSDHISSNDTQSGETPSATTGSAIWTILKLISWTEEYFKSFDVDSPRLTAEILLCHALTIRRLDLYIQFDRPLNRNELATYKALIKRRAKKEPVAYITGVKGFWDSQFFVTPDVLIPRPDTETLVEAALTLIKRRRGSGGAKTIKVLELGTGSGAIIISLARLNPDLLFYATDISHDAVMVARQNHAHLSASGESLNNLFFLTGSWLTPIRPATQFDIIVSNPPYIPTSDIEILQQEVRDYEPRLALDGGSEGISSLKEIMESAHDYLEPEGVLLMEIAFDQRQKIIDEALLILQYDPPEFIKDYAGHDRVVSLKKRIKIIENKNKI